MTASRRRGIGSITSYSTKSGVRWRWQLRVPVDDGGSTRQVGRGGYATAKEADDGLQAARQAVREQRKLARGGPPTIESYSEQWVAGLQLENSTLAGYRKILRNHVVPELGAVRLDHLTATRLARHYRELLTSGYRGRDGTLTGRGLSANSVNKVHVVIGAMLDSAVDDGHIAINPARKRRTVKAPTGKQIRAAAPEIVTFTAAELRAFLQWDRDTYQDELYPLWLCLALTGMRRGEALALRWADVDLEHRRISIRRAADPALRGVTKSTKTGAGRVVDVDDELTQALRQYRAQRGALSLTLARPAATIFSDLDGQLLDPKRITDRWMTRLRAARRTPTLEELPHVTIKGLRHTHATLLLSAGVHPKVVQERLGHSNISTTMNIYSHVTPTMQRDAVARLVALMQ